MFSGPIGPGPNPQTYKYSNYLVGKLSVFFSSQSLKSTNQISQIFEFVMINYIQGVFFFLKMVGRQSPGLDVF